MKKLFFRYGSMNCGKTTHLLQTAHNYERENMKVLIMKPILDTKGNKKIVSRIGIEKTVNHLIKQNENIYNYIINYKNINNIKCILIDEAQFLNRKQVDELLKLVNELNIDIICYGIRLDFLANGFEGSTRLLEIAHSIEELKTICRCGNKATFNARYVNNKFTITGNQIKIDGFDKVTYKSLCSKCYYDEINKLNSSK